MLGKDSNQTSEINKLNPTTVFKDYKTLIQEIDSTEVILQKLGYIALERDAIVRKNDSTYSILFDLQTRYEQMRLFFPENMEIFGLTKRDFQLVSREISDNYFILPFIQIEESLEILNALIAENGFPFTTLQMVEIQPAADSPLILEAILQIITDDLRKITGIEIRGYDKFPRSYLKYIAGIKEGNLFQREKITEKSSLLDNLGFVRNTKSPEVLFTKEETRLYLYLEKTNNNLFDGIIGFATNEETNKLEFNGYLNFVLSNNLNYGEKLTLDYKNDGQDQQQFRINTELPFLFKSPFGLELELQFFKRDSTFLTVEKHALANYQLNVNTKLFGGYKDYESTYLLDTQIPGEVITDYTSVFFVFGGSYLKPQRNSLFPYKTSARIRNEIGFRKSGNTSTDQFRTTLTANHIINLNFNNSIYLNNHTALLTGSNYLINELFRFGGINSIRGFDENSIDASLFSVLNTEYRYQLGNDTYIHSIL
ncbi:MAG: hypothetical protein H0X63_00640, partial [Flavobacteriales bacterium]|nr:hypothetical protein [Flavobacteriales bacterium]